ncbi:MmcQ/YjbR family DNA-binding protein [Peribacillus sp. Bi134]|uniref:MmcQ/YjbR family DNA-binding protein n=1 Tax=Peribacillus sp. Bi134 TaxID=2884272 RepID=UPI001D5AC09D|nr:hypothetical protein SRABI134_01191 [Peribacillus sp. Bi134]
MKSQETAAMLENVRNICLALPEAVEHIDGFGHNTFKINGKSFVISGESEKGFSLSFKSDRETQELLLQKENFFQNSIYRTSRLGLYSKSGWGRLG